MGTEKYPQTMEEAILKGYHPTQDALETIDKNQLYVVHPYGRGNLTTNGVQYSTISNGTTGVTTNSSAQSVAFSSTISFPGLDKALIDEIEFGLTAELKASTNTLTTQVFQWQWKASSETTWQSLHTAVSLKSTAYAARTLSGYASPGTGYQRLPINIRLLHWNKTANQGRVRAKNSSYVVITAKKV